MRKHSVLSQQQWEDTIKGFDIIDCTFFEENKFLLVVKENIPDEEYDVLKESTRETRGVAIIFSSIEIKCGTYGVGGLRFPRVCTAQKPELRGILSSRQNDGLVFAVGKGGIKEIEHITPEGKPGPTTSCNTRKLKCIDGWAYAVGMGRRVFKRIEKNRWIPILEGLSWPEQMDYMDMGFQDIHGPNENNMYAVGGCGDVWHYNGEKWEWCDFPSNEQLSCVLVAPDGVVYISGEGGNLWRGSMHTWEKIYTGDSSVLNKDLVWYNNQLWVSSDYQLRVWNDKELLRPTHNGEQIIASGNMDVYENLLLIADLDTAKLFDGNEWHTIVSPYS
ncbi:hypothetical protein [Cellvibrio sp. NN19]|uniref:hypothetical protein n=1 Tax=Cellvibrio chitinivorans TaxID=3102792 RepID=UPI002B41584F|nr:hypothetical protein [Cellvibrio sp. NN19]